MLHCGDAVEMVAQPLIGRGEAARLPGAQILHRLIEDLARAVELRVAQEYLGIPAGREPDAKRRLKLLGAESQMRSAASSCSAA